MECVVLMGTLTCKGMTGHIRSFEVQWELGGRCFDCPRKLQCCVALILGRCGQICIHPHSEPTINQNIDTTEIEL